MLRKSVFFLTLIITSIIYTKSNAQLLSGNVFLQGQYIEVGVAKNGTLVPNVSAPAGYHPVSAGHINLVCDRDKDGWGVGTPLYYGDLFDYGSPYESWKLQVNGVMAKPIYGTDDSITSGMIGSCTSHSIIGKSKIAIWEGLFGNLEVVKKISIDTNKIFIHFRVAFTNKGSSTLKNIYYAREADIDHPEEYGLAMFSGFLTTLKIQHQIPNSKDEVTISSTSEYYKSYISLSSKDCRAKAYFMNVGLSSSHSLDTIYNKLEPSGRYKYLEGDTLFSDVGMGLVFKIDSLISGESKVIEFAYILDTLEIDSILFKESEPKWQTSLGSIKNSGDTVWACEGDSIGVEIFGAGSINWIWDTSTLIATKTGPINKIRVTGKNSYRAIRNNLELCGGIDTIVLNINAWAKPNPIIVKSGINLSTSSPYITYQWIQDDTLILGALGKNFTATKNGVYKVLVTDSNGCQNVSDTILVTDFTSSINNHFFDQQITFSPNPSKNIVNINAPLDLSIRIKDLSGRTILHYSNSKTIDISSLINGVYIIEFRNNEESLMDIRKLIKE